MRQSFSMLALLADVGWRARCSESCTAGSGKGGGKRIREDNALAAYFTPTVSNVPFATRVKETVGRGRACLRVWPQLCIATVIKRTQKKRVVEITRRMTQGLLSSAEKLLQQSRGGTVLNTAFIERLNGTMRERLASLTRTCRHAAHRLDALETGMHLIGCTYNLCFPHHELSHASHGSRLNRSYLEYWGSPDV